MVLQDESGAVENVDANSMLVIVPYETGGAGFQSPCMKIFPTGHYSILPYLAINTIVTGMIIYGSAHRGVTIFRYRHFFVTQQTF